MSSGRFVRTLNRLRVRWLQRDAVVLLFDWLGTRSVTRRAGGAPHALLSRLAISFGRLPALELLAALKHGCSRGLKWIHCWRGIQFVLAMPQGSDQRNRHLSNRINSIILKKNTKKIANLSNWRLKFIKRKVNTSAFKLITSTESYNQMHSSIKFLIFFRKHSIFQCKQ